MLPAALLPLVQIETLLVPRARLRLLKLVKAKVRAWILASPPPIIFVLIEASKLDKCPLGCNLPTVILIKYIPWNLLAVNTTNTLDRFTKLPIAVMIGNN